MRRVAFALAVASLAACGQTATELPAHGEALFVVDTDLPVPGLAGRLRVDVYSEEGVWLDSRDIGRSDPRDWPASFSVFSDDESRPRRALVRLRAYAEGATRGYRGESRPAPAVYAPPKVAASIDDMCANAPLLPIGGRATLRQGNDPIVQHATTYMCPNPAVAGAFATRVEITASGAYRFSVADSSPYDNYTTLSLRSSCADVTTQLACHTGSADNGNSSGHFARFDATLTPGTYWLFSTGALPGWASDTTVEVMPLDTPLPPVAPVTEATPTSLPRLVTGGVDRTPDSEPLPTASVDRLVLVELVPGVRGTARVTLRGACAGTPADLGAAGAVDLAKAATCVETPGARAPIAPLSLDPGLSRGGASVQGTFGPDEPCAPADPTSARVCIRGGAFLLATDALAAIGTQTEVAPYPERLAVMPRFWIDRYEYSVARLRAAVARGYVVRPDELAATEKAHPKTADEIQRLDDFCTWSAAPMGREDFPLVCISWRMARELCALEGGDLPTEAQWEYAAIGVNRAFKATFPWGEEDLPCAHGVLGRFPTELGGMHCADYPLGPRPVTAPDGREGTLPDVTPEGVVGLGTNATEWTLDAMGAYDGPCWNASGLVSPRCAVDPAPGHMFRGAGWIGPSSAAVNRSAAPGAAPAVKMQFRYADPQMGFRCAYAKEAP